MITGNSTVYNSRFYSHYVHISETVWICFYLNSPTVACEKEPDEL